MLLMHLMPACLAFNTNLCGKQHLRDAGSSMVDTEVRVWVKLCMHTWSAIAKTVVFVFYMAANKILCRCPPSSVHQWCSSGRVDLLVRDQLPVR